MKFNFTFFLLALIIGIIAAMLTDFAGFAFPSITWLLMDIFFCIIIWFFVAWIWYFIDNK